MWIGLPGTGKTTVCESLAVKFDESEYIFEAGNSTLKGLIPSFKEKPANIGYIARCSRYAIIDELFKMIENRSNQHQGTYAEVFKTQLSQLNMLLEHKSRTVGSGNDNTTQVRATAKCLMVGNPL